MTIANSPRAYDDCYDLLDKALETTKGLRRKMPNSDAATFLRMRLHNARKIDREKNAKTYPEPDDPMHMASVYDRVVIRIKRDSEGGVWIYLEFNPSLIEAAESLDDLKEEPMEAVAMNVREPVGPNVRRRM